MFAALPAPTQAQKETVTMTTQAKTVTLYMDADNVEIDWRGENRTEGAYVVQTYEKASATNAIVYEYENDAPHTIRITAQNLTSLDCHSNQLTALDVSGNTALVQLYCHDNRLTALNVSNNKDLMWLDCGKNQLTALDVSSNMALWHFTCNNNRLTALDVSGNTTLTYLDCDNNRLTALDVSRNTDLKNLYCSDNQLTALDVSGNTALEYLSCSGNRLTALDVSGNTALEYLNCSSNRLTVLDVSGNTALKNLNCDNNRLTALDTSRNTALEDLSYSNNQLTDSSSGGGKSDPKLHDDNHINISVSDALSVVMQQVTYRWESGSAYKGQSMANGRVIFRWESGSYYIGDFSNNDRDGYGMYIAAEGYEISGCSGSRFYVGNYSAGKKSGKGSCYDKRGNLTYCGEFADDRPVDAYPSDGSKHGKYKLCTGESSDGNRFIGETVTGGEGLHGYGIYIWADGDAWFGTWENGEQKGKGLFLLQDGKWELQQVDGENGVVLASSETDVDTQNRTASSHYNNKEYEQAVYWWRKSADQGSGLAQSNLGVCYYNGQGVTKDFEQAERWWRKAIANGYTEAEAKLETLLQYKEQLAQYQAQQQENAQYAQQQQTTYEQQQQSQPQNDLFDAFISTMESLTAIQNSRNAASGYSQGSSGSGGSSSGGGSSSSEYQSSYNRWESHAKRAYDALLDKQTTATRSVNNKNLRNAQTEMRSIRNNASRNGIVIRQSFYETANP
jgi:TPR repeat protein